MGQQIPDQQIDRLFILRYTTQLRIMSTITKINHVRRLEVVRYF